MRVGTYPYLRLLELGTWNVQLAAEEIALFLRSCPFAPSLSVSSALSLVRRGALPTSDARRVVLLQGNWQGRRLLLSAGAGSRRAQARTRVLPMDHGPYERIRVWQRCDSERKCTTPRARSPISDVRTYVRNFFVLVNANVIVILPPSSFLPSFLLFVIF